VDDRRFTTHQHHGDDFPVAGGSRLDLGVVLAVRRPFP
jgi:hypothetical protein